MEGAPLPHTLQQLAELESIPANQRNEYYQSEKENYAKLRAAFLKNPEIPPPVKTHFESKKPRDTFFRQLQKQKETEMNLEKEYWSTKLFYDEFAPLKKNE